MKAGYRTDAQRPCPDSTGSGVSPASTVSLLEEVGGAVALFPRPFQAGMLGPWPFEGAMPYPHLKGEQGQFLSRSLKPLRGLNSAAVFVK